MSKTNDGWYNTSNNKEEQYTYKVNDDVQYHVYKGFEESNYKIKVEHINHLYFINASNNKNNLDYVKRYCEAHALSIYGENV